MAKTLREELGGFLLTSALFHYPLPSGRQCKQLQGARMGQRKCLWKAISGKKQQARFSMTRVHPLSNLHSCASASAEYILKPAALLHWQGWRRQLSFRTHRRKCASGTVGSKKALSRSCAGPHPGDVSSRAQASVIFSLPRRELR